MTDETKICPACAEEIKLEARRCRYCGEIVGDKERKQLENKRALTIGCIVLAVFLVGYWFYERSQSVGVNFFGVEVQVDRKNIDQFSNFGKELIRELQQEMEKDKKRKQ